MEGQLVHTAAALPRLAALQSLAPRHPCRLCPPPSRCPGTPRCKTSCGAASERAPPPCARLTMPCSTGDMADCSLSSIPCVPPRPAHLPGWASWPTSWCGAWAGPLPTSRARRCTGAKTPTTGEAGRARRAPSGVSPAVHRGPYSTPTTLPPFTLAASPPSGLNALTMGIFYEALQR